MFSQFEEILRHHPAGLSVRAFQPENTLAKIENLERKPYRRPQTPPPISDRVSFAGGITLLISLFLFLIAVLAP